MTDNPCPRCNDEGTINVEDRPYPNDISPSTHEEPCTECHPSILAEIACGGAA